MQRVSAVSKAASAAVFAQGSGFEFRIGSGRDPLLIRSSTVWSRRSRRLPETPNHLVVHVEGRFDGTLNDAADPFTQMALHATVLLAFVSNTAISEPELELLYDSSPGVPERRFQQYFVSDPDPQTLLGGRLLKTEELASFFRQYFETPPSERLKRAVLEYSSALRAWQLGKEFRSVQSLYVAAELLRTMERKRLVGHLTAADYAESVGLQDEREIDPHIMKEVIFQGDAPTYKAAHRIRNSTFHGFGTLTEAQSLARENCGRVFDLVRQAIIREVDPEQELPAPIAERAPLDIASRRKLISGKILSESAISPEELGGQYWAFPHLLWATRVTGLEETADGYSWGFTENFTVRMHPKASFQAEQIGVVARTDDLPLGPPSPLSSSRREHVENTSDLVDTLRRIQTACGAGLNAARPRGSNDLRLFAALADVLAMYESVLLLIDHARWTEAAPLAAQMVEMGILTIEAVDSEAGSDRLAETVRRALDCDRAIDAWDGAEEATEEIGRLVPSQAQFTLESVEQRSSALGLADCLWPWVVGSALRIPLFGSIARVHGPPLALSTHAESFEQEVRIGLGAATVAWATRSAVVDALEVAPHAASADVDGWLSALRASVRTTSSPDPESL